MSLNKITNRDHRSGRVARGLCPGGGISNQNFNNARSAINDAGDLIIQALQLMGQ